MGLPILTEQSYADFIEERFDDARASGERVVFTNRGSSDARVILKTFFHSATKSLELFTGCLNGEVYDASALIDAARRLSKGSIRVLVANHPLRNSSALFDLQPEAAAGQILVNAFERAGEETVARRYPNFAICDERHFRIERDHATKTSMVMLNGQAEPLAKEYRDLFEQLWEQSRPIDWSRIANPVPAVA
jgi:hypothetical protein